MTKDIREQIEHPLPKSWEKFIGEDGYLNPGMHRIDLSLALDSHKEEWVREGYKKGLDDMFTGIYDLAEPDERQPSAGVLNTHMDDIHEIRSNLINQMESK